MTKDMKGKGDIIVLAIRTVGEMNAALQTDVWENFVFDRAEAPPLIFVGVGDTDPI